MRLHTASAPRLRNQSGQTLVLFVLMIVVLLLVVGLGIDLGFAYLTKSSLSKAVDSACLMGMRNLPLGQSNATAVAQAAFAANYPFSGRDTQSPVVPTVSFDVDASNHNVINVSATTTISTFFIRVLPQWQTLTVGASAQAVRANLVMSLVLDRSGSMACGCDPTCLGSCGAGKLPGAVTDFVNQFDDNVDRVAMVSFATTATLDVPLEQPFREDITSKADQLVFQGETYVEGGLLLAKTQNERVSAAPGIIRAVVFFTDGLANSFHSTFAGCPPEKAVTGFGNGSFCLADPTTDEVPNNCDCSPTAGDAPPCCPGATLDGNSVIAEAEARALSVANQMRQEGMIVFSIGLGSQVNRNFLLDIANDPRSPAFDPNLPVGEFVFASTAADLESVFQKIGSSVLLRLSK